MTIERITVRTALLEIAVDVWGPADGDPVLLLHGFPYDPRSFDKAAPLLAAQGLRCYAPFLRGFGPTRFLSDATMRSGQQTAIADDGRALLDALGIQKALIAGFDWGARAACICAALWPERFVGMLTVGGYLIQDLADPTKLMPAAIEHLIWHQYFIGSARGRRALAERPQEICLYLRRQWSPGLGDEALFAETAKSFANPDFAEVSWHSYAHRIGAVAGDPRYDALDAALVPPPPVPVPAVVLTGDKARLAGALSDRFPALVAHRVAPGAGHDPAAETPQAFADAMCALREAASA
jgi:pimeloyl-ACP methyl ester carboxylesterase